MSLSLKNRNQWNCDDLVKLAGLLAGRPIERVEQAGSGSNSRVYKVNDKNKEELALKFYRLPEPGQHDRFVSEVKALELFTCFGFSQTPRLVGINRPANCVLMEWVQGGPIKQFDRQGIDESLKFLEFLHSLRDQIPLQDVPFGAEACLNRTELMRQIHLRRANLKYPMSEDSALRTFLADDFDPSFRIVDEWSADEYARLGWGPGTDLAERLLTLSPVDFGSHNVLCRPDGKLTFLDFEYFGWDDPVHLVADTLQHPGMELKGALAAHFLKRCSDIYGDGDPDFYERLRILYPLYGLRWCMIMLNPFLPGYIVPGSAQMDGPQKRSWQLDRLKRVIQRVKRITENYKELLNDER